VAVEVELEAKRAPGRHASEAVRCQVSAVRETG
jgi:hypothetical protein